MSRHRFYVLKGHKVVPVADVHAWARAFEFYNRIVAQETIGDARVSTVFLGLDHRHSGDGPPLLFETMVFGGEDGDWQERCSTWKEAEAQHARICFMVRETLSAKQALPEQQ